MMIKKYFIYLLLVLTLPLAPVFAQNENPPFWNDIRKFISRDSIQMPPQQAVLFIGSSSFTMWTGLQDSFPTHTVINRGFGGSTLQDLLRYENEIIFRYHPKQVVIYCGENDMASSDSVTAQMVFERFRKLFEDIRKQYPSTFISFISMKPSPSRWWLKDKLIEGNKLISEFLIEQPNAHFINVWDEMIAPGGHPRSDLFISDNLHMNEQGYSLWKKLIEPYLLK